MLELAADGHLIAMTPTGGDTGARLGWLLIPAERAVEVWGVLQGGEQGRRIEAASRCFRVPIHQRLHCPCWRSR